MSELTRYHDAIEKIESSPNEETLVRLWLSQYPRATAAEYERDIAQFFEHVPKSLKDITVPDLIAYHEILQNEHKYSKRTIIKKLSALRSMFGFALKIGFIKTNPAGLMRVPRWKGYDITQRILSIEEIERLLAHTRTQREYLILALLYYGGMRVAELGRLRWRDVMHRTDLNTGQITLRGKGDKMRTILIPRQIWSRLIDSRARMDGPDDPILRSNRGNPLSVRQIQRTVENLGKRADLKRKLSPHDLRHSHATHAHQKGVPMGVLADTLGHESFSTTRIYLHTSPTESSSFYLPIFD